MSRHLVPWIGLLLAAAIVRAEPAQAQPATPATAMPVLQRFVIEREIPGASRMTAEQWRGAAAKSNGVLHKLGPDIQWVHSYVAGDKVYCVYQATSEALIRQHSELSGFPANRITPIANLIDPTTAVGKR